jgi:hypothetical protein
MITDRIELNIHPNMIIPKPEATADFKVKGWGSRRGQKALIYLIPNHSEPTKPYQKGVTANEFTLAYNELIKSGEFTRRWFNSELPACAKEGGCNFTTIGGVFQLLGIATYESRGTYLRLSQDTCE